MRRKYCTKIQTSWKQEFPFIAEGFKGKGHALCNICRADFSVEHDGRIDVNHHQETERMKLQAAKHTHSISMNRRQGANALCTYTKHIYMQIKVFLNSNFFFGGGSPQASVSKFAEERKRECLCVDHYAANTVDVSYCLGAQWATEPGK